MKNKKKVFTHTNYYNQQYKSFKFIMILIVIFMKMCVLFFLILLKLKDCFA